MQTLPGVGAVACSAGKHRQRLQEQVLPVLKWVAAPFKDRASQCVVIQLGRVVCRESVHWRGKKSAIEVAWLDPYHQCCSGALVPFHLSSAMSFAATCRASLCWCLLQAPPCPAVAPKVLQHLLSFFTYSCPPNSPCLSPSQLNPIGRKASLVRV